MQNHSLNSPPALLGPHPPRVTHIIQLSEKYPDAIEAPWRMDAVRRWGVWASDFKLREGKELIHLLSTKGSTPLVRRRALSKPGGLLIILSTEESPVLIN